MRELPAHVTRIINYVRKSREEEPQEERDGIDALERQRVQMEKVLKKYGVPYDQEKEVGSGDKIDSRPIFQRILKEIESGKYQAIAVREISRLGRGSYGDMGTIYDLLEQRRILIITENNIYDPRNADHAKFIRMQLFISREEYFMIKERLVNARYFRAKEEGKFMGSRPAYGYRSNAKTKKLEIHEPEADVVKKIFNWYVHEEMGYQAISTKLIRLGIPTYTGGKHWQGLVIRRMLTNPVYLGSIYFRTTETINGKKVERPKEEWLIHEDAHPAIIDEETFLAAQIKLRERNKNKLPVKEQYEPCELAGLVQCSCGKKYVRQYSTQHYQKKDSEEVSVYHKEFLYCVECRKSIKYRDVEAQILSIFMSIKELDQVKLREMLTDTLNQKQQAKRSVGTSEKLTILEQNRIRVQNKIQFILDQYEEGIYTKDEFIRQKAKRQEELETIESEIAKIRRQHSQPDELAVDVESVRNKISTILQAYQKLNNKTRKNALLRRVFDHVEVDILEKGIGRKPSKLAVKGYFRYDFLL